MSLLLDPPTGADGMPSEPSVVHGLGVAGSGLAEVLAGAKLERRTWDEANPWPVLPPEPPEPLP